VHALSNAAFLAALRASHSVVTRARVVGGPVLGRVVGGSVPVDRNAAVRRRCTFEVLDEAGLLVPQGPPRLLSAGAIVAAGGGIAAPNPAGGGTSLSLATDGVTVPGPYVNVDGDFIREAYVQVDLGAVFRIGSVKVWHYYLDGRTYFAPRTDVSEDGVTWTTVARPTPYAETAAGHTRTFDPIRARYVRDYLNGSNQNSGNHWTEVQVFSGADALNATGGEVVLERGVRLPDGSAVYVPLGVFGLTDVDATNGPDGVRIAAKGYDRAYGIARARFVAPYVIAAGTNVGTALQALIASRRAGLSYAITPTTRVTPALVYDTGADPWKAATELASSIGYEVFFDADGVLVARPEPDPATAAVVDTYEPGAASILAGTGKSTTTEQTYSRVVVTGEAADGAVPVRAEAYDATIGALIGDVPYFLTSALITTQAQADEVAAATLRRVQSLTEQVKAEAIVSPGLAEGDVVRVADPRLLLDASYVVDSFTVPLTGAKHTLAMRKRKT
jgi:hypothetical protein